MGNDLTEIKKGEVAGQRQGSPRRIYSGEEKTHLSKALAACGVVLKSYGRKPEDLPLMVEGFCMFLSKYPMWKIVEGIKLWGEVEQEFPTPADIAMMITMKIGGEDDG